MKLLARALWRQATDAEHPVGYEVMSFWNNEILGDINAVLEQIQYRLIEAPSPQPSPGGRGS